MRTVVFIVFTFTIVACGLLFTARIMLQNHYANLLTDNGKVNDRNSVVYREINETNQKLSKIRNVQNDFVKWSNVMLDLIRAIPNNVEITYINLEHHNLNFNLKGTALQRDDYLKLEANLKALPFIEGLYSPLTNILRRDNVSFEFSAKLKQSAL
jgi:Tfp pilus assembly protein PilN